MGKTTTINVEEILEGYNNSYMYRETGELKRALEICDRLIAKYPDNHKALRDVVWNKAVTLDISGKANEALPLATELVSRFPMNSYYQSSLKIIVGNCHSLARDIYRENPLSPVLRNYWTLFREFHCPALWLTKAVAMIDASEGKALDAKQKMSDLLELSPRDEEYLRAAIKVAKALKDEAWLHALRKQAAAVAAERPDLEKLSKEFEVKEQVALRN